MHAICYLAQHSPLYEFHQTLDISIRVKVFKQLMLIRGNGLLSLSDIRIGNRYSYHIDTIHKAAKRGGCVRGICPLL